MLIDKNSSLSSKKLFQAVSSVLFETDLMNINYSQYREDNNQYQLEAEMIILRLESASSEKDLQLIIYQVFQECFGEISVGELALYTEVSERIWKICNDSKG